MSHRIYGDEPMLVRQSEATRILWGDAESGQVSDLLYGRGERVSGFIYLLGPGHWFGASRTWKPFYDQHRVYYVVQGTLAIHDPESGEVAVAGPGEAVTWRGARYHFGYNTGSDEVVVLDFVAPAEGAPDVWELEYSPSKRDLSAILGGRYELLEAWPDRRLEELRRRADEGGLLTVGPGNALHLIHGTKLPLLVSILSSSGDMTAGTFALRGGAHSEPERHPGDEVVFALTGRLNVHLPESGDWFELNPLDCLFLPEGTTHEYWSYGAETTTAVFCVAPGYLEAAV
jgi:mannose-6-phosphate isomerase-like protein (cupin superfamily)